MNYGKKKAAKRQKQITSKSAMQAKRVGVRLFKALLLCIIVVAIAGVAGGGEAVRHPAAHVHAPFPGLLQPGIGLGLSERRSGDGGQGDDGEREKTQRHADVGFQAVDPSPECMRRPFGCTSSFVDADSMLFCNACMNSARFNPAGMGGRNS